jgi:RNA polymerase sigma-70 factor (ECF subfamily)
MLSQNDQERFMRLWTSHQSSVANYIRSLVHDHATAADLLQETALIIFRRFAEYDEQRPFIAWALGIARFQVMGMQRDAKRDIVVFDDDVLEKFTESWIEQTEEKSDQSAALESCLDRLASHAQRIVRLRYFEDQNADKIAQQLGGNGATIRVTLQRIREQLRICIERQLQFEGGIS